MHIHALACQGPFAWKSFCLCLVGMVSSNLLAFPDSISGEQGLLLPSCWRSCILTSHEFACRGISVHQIHALTQKPRAHSAALARARAHPPTHTQVFGKLRSLRVIVAALTHCVHPMISVFAVLIIVISVCKRP